MDELDTVSSRKGVSNGTCPASPIGMRDILLTLTIFGSIPIILVKPHIGVLMWSWISYMNPHRLTWSFAFDFRFALLIGATTILAWLFSREPKRLPWSGVTCLLMALFVWITITTFFALYPDQAATSWERVAKILLFNGIVTLALMQSKQRVNALIWVIVMSIGYLGIKGGVFTLLTGGNYHVMGPARSFITDNNDFGLAMVMVIPLMRYLQLASNYSAVRWGLTAMMFLSFIAALGTQSRGTFLGVVVLVVMLFLKTRRRLLIGIGVATVLIVGVNFMPDFWYARMESIAAYQEDASAQGRFNAWAYAIDVALAHPITGGGFGAFLGNTTWDYGFGRAAHSIYFQMLGEQGFVGLALYLSLGVATYLTGGAIVRKAKARPELRWASDLASMVQVSLVTYAVSGAFLSRAYFDLYYHLVVIMILTNAVVTEALAVSERDGRRQAPLDEGVPRWKPS